MMKTRFCSGLRAETAPVPIGRGRRPRRKVASGFTAIELMVVLAVVAILLAMAVPSFIQLIQKNRVAGEINAFVGDLQFARGEAIKQGQPVTICASSDGTTCLGTAVWETGWIVFADPDNNQTRNAADPQEAVLRKQPRWTSTDTFGASGSIGAITYSRDGFAFGLTGAATFTLHTNPVNADISRCVAVNVTGRQEIQSPSQGNCT